ncbi:hypothetical protein AMECASPLE_008161 [Ameca splendens]|uniref:Uncharacterized protein n=1 Tax=Ameca splendens TaxID=208324 RepID=A0ABV0YB25_9TELE
MSQSPRSGKTITLTRPCSESGVAIVPLLPRQHRLQTSLSQRLEPAARTDQTQARWAPQIFSKPQIMRGVLPLSVVLLTTPLLNPPLLIVTLGTHFSKFVWVWGVYFWFRSSSTILQ